MDNLQRKADEIAEKFLKDHKGIGLSAAVINKNGEVVHENFYGYKNMEQKELLDEHTIHGIASISKSFTALSIMQLVEKGKISVHDLVSDYIPAFNNPDNKEKVTIEHFLTHTGGFTPLKRSVIHDYEEKWAKDSIEPLTDTKFLDQARVEIASKMSGAKTPMTPGEYASYCNDGYALLSEIVREKGGHDNFEAYMQANIFKPLHMDRSTNRYNIQDLDNISVLYEWKDDVLCGHQDFRENLMILPGGGSVKSTLHNMKQYLQFYLQMDSHEEVLSPFYKREMMKPRIIFGNQMYYGYGLRTYGEDDLTVFGHGGSLPGVSSHIIWSYEAELGVVILCNTRAVPVAELANYMLRLFHTKNIEIPLYEKPLGAYTWTENFRKKVAGVYESEEGVSVEITAIEGTENMEIKTGESTYPISMISPFSGFYTAKTGNSTYIRFIETKDFLAIHFGGRVVPKVTK